MTTFAQSIPGRLMSKEYLAAPVVLSGASMREMRLPMSVRWSAVGQSTFTILRASFLRGVGDREQHARVGAEATKIASQPSPNFIHRSVRMLSYEGGGRSHKTRRAK